MQSILSRLLPPREEKFFNYFGESADICYEMATVFFNITHKGVTEELFIAVKQLKKDSNLILRQNQKERRNEEKHPSDIQIGISFSFGGGAINKCRGRQCAQD